MIRELGLAKKQAKQEVGQLSLLVFFSMKITKIKLI